MSFRPYSGGELPNWGCHGLSEVQWVLGMDNSGPVEIWVDPAEKMEPLVYDAPEKKDRGKRLQPARHQATSMPTAWCWNSAPTIPRWDKGTLHRRQGLDQDVSQRVRVRPEGPRRGSASGECQTCLRERQPHAELLRLRWSPAKTRS